MEDQVVINLGMETTFTYTNYKGEKRIRKIVPLRLYFGVALPYYDTPQWLLEGYDLVKQGRRVFALNNINTE